MKVIYFNDGGFSLHVAHVNCKCRSKSVSFSFTAITLPVENPIPVMNEGSALIQLDPNNVQSQLNLSCTAEVEGSFQWQWTATCVDSYFANANRTSFYTLTEISADSAGSFTCEARYTNNNTVSGSTSFTIEFQPSKFLYIRKCIKTLSRLLVIIYVVLA